MKILSENAAFPTKEVTKLLRTDGACPSEARAINQRILAGEDLLTALRNRFAELKVLPSTYNTYCSQIHSLIRQAYIEYDRDPTFKGEILMFFERTRKKEYESEPAGIVIPQQDMLTLLTYSGERTSLLMQMLIFGMRVSEACNAHLTTFRPFDQNIMEMKMRGKGKKMRKILFPRQLFEKIREVFQGKMYFFETANHKRYLRQEVANMIKDASDRLLGYTITPHDFRYTFATRLLEAGASIQSIMQHGGWGSLESFKHYLVMLYRIKPHSIIESVRPEWDGERLGYKHFEPERRTITA